MKKKSYTLKTDDGVYWLPEGGETFYADKREDETFDIYINYLGSLPLFTGIDEIEAINLLVILNKRYPVEDCGDGFVFDNRTS